MGELLDWHKAVSRYLLKCCQDGRFFHRFGSPALTEDLFLNQVFALLAKIALVVLREGKQRRQCKKEEFSSSQGSSRPRGSHVGSHIVWFYNVIGGERRPSPLNVMAGCDDVSTSIWNELLWGQRPVRPPMLTFADVDQIRDTRALPPSPTIGPR